MMAESRPVALKTNSSFSAALRRGEPIETHKRWSAGQNKQRPIVKNVAKLDEETETHQADLVDLEVARLIMKARNEKGLSQKDLAARINEKVQVVAEYEKGEGLKNQLVLSKLERALGVKLRGKDKGQPLTFQKKK
ncbi:unnamed protein product [Dicrocoelium dendriticum]|nr:unnamed protein product [Dicrocoelium dendriticum]